MRTLRVTVSDSEYEALQKIAGARDRSVEQLIQETLASFHLRDLPVFPGHRAVADLPSRSELYEEMFSVGDSGSRP